MTMGGKNGNRLVVIGRESYCQRVAVVGRGGDEEVENGRVHRSCSHVE